MKADQRTDRMPETDKTMTMANKDSDGWWADLERDWEGEKGGQKWNWRQSEGDRDRQRQNGCKRSGKQSLKNRSHENWKEKREKKNRGKEQSTAHSRRERKNKHTVEIKHTWTHQRPTHRHNKFMPTHQHTLPVMAAVAVRKKVVSIGHFSPSFCL